MKDLKPAILRTSKGNINNLSQLKTSNKYRINSDIIISKIQSLTYL